MPSSITELSTRNVRLSKTHSFLKTMVCRFSTYHVRLQSTVAFKQAVDSDGHWQSDTGLSGDCFSPKSLSDAGIGSRTLGVNVN